MESRYIYVIDIYFLVVVVNAGCFVNKSSFVSQNVLLLIKNKTTTIIN